MICTQCGREIPDGSLSCNYCGKIFVTKRAKPDALPADNQAKPLGSGAAMKQALADVSTTSVNQAVKLRRYQRWGFYVLIVVLFVSGLAYIIKLSNDYSDSIAKLQAADSQLVAKEKEVADAKEAIASTNKALIDSKLSMDELKELLAKNKDSLTKALDDNQKISNELKAKEEEFNKTSDSLLKSQAVNRNLIMETGVKLGRSEVSKLPLAPLEAMSGVDTDKDGLTDDLEPALGTDPMLADSDNDGFNDMDELNKGYNPLGKGALASDVKLGEKYRGRFVLQTDNASGYYGWYVSLGGKRYYLGHSRDNFTAMLGSAFWAKTDGNQQ